MASSYFRSCSFGLCHELKVTIQNGLVSRSKRSLEDFQEGEQVLLPDVKKQRCSSPVSSPKSLLETTVPSGNEEAGSQDYSQMPSGNYDDSDLDSSLLEKSDGEPPDSPYSGTPEEDDKLLADDLETDSSNVSGNVSVSPETFLTTGLSVPSSSGLPRSTDPADAERGSNVNLDSQNQIGINLSSGGAGPIEIGGFSLKKGNSVPGVVDEEARQMVGEGSLVGSVSVAEHKCASVATNGLSEGQAFVEQGEVGGERANNSSCETQGESASTTDVVPEHFIAAQNKESIEDHSPEEPEEPSPEEPKEPSPDDSRSHWIFIPEEELQLSKEKYIAGVLAHAQHNRHLIGKPEAKSQKMASKAIHESKKVGEVNELHALMRRVAFEHRPWTPKHPTDLTVRNYAQRNEIQKCTLDQWVNRNQRNFRRFKNIPDKFRRSPITS